MSDGQMNIYWVCRADGFSPKNRANWCDLGCGRDYNMMVKFTGPQIQPLLNQAKIAEIKRIKSTSSSSDTMIFAKGMPLKGTYFAVYADGLDTRLKALGDRE